MVYCAITVVLLILKFSVMILVSRANWSVLLYRLIVTKFFGKNDVMLNFVLLKECKYYFLGLWQKTDWMECFWVLLAWRIEMTISCNQANKNIGF